MSDMDNQKVTKYLKQMSLAIAILLILYGVAYFLNYFLDLVNFSLSYLIWIFFQTVLAIILIFIGTRIYMLSRTSRSGNLFHNGKFRPQIAAIAMGCLSILPFILFPLPPSPWLHSIFFRPAHQPISFSYRLGYSWDHQSGASIHISTVAEFSHGGVTILYDIEPIFGSRVQGWSIIPYRIYDSPGGHIEVISPAIASIQLGKIMSRDYVLKIIMSDATDTFYVQKTPQTFSLEEGIVTKGKLVEKNNFEKRLDGFRVEYVGYPVIDNNTKQFIINRICQLGGVVLGTENGSTDGWLVYLNFLYAGDEINLQHIITQLANDNTGYWIRIQSNTGWFRQISQYCFSVAVGSLENSNTIKNILLREHLLVFGQKNESFLNWENSTIFYGSSAPLDRTWCELRDNFIQLISNETNLKYWMDFWVSY
jgi:hypothetical protein